jgi:hypothetical protein
MRSRRLAFLFLGALVLAISLSLVATPHAVWGDRDHDRSRNDDDQDRALQSDPRVQVGISISPVPINSNGKHRNLAGLGSYLVNAVASCNDCHTCPSYQPGHSPYTGGDGAINTTNFLAGGVAFGPGLTSANLTPDFSGKPAGLTFDEFLSAIRTGKDPKPPHDILQVMVWPVLRHMSDSDLRAIYEYLSAIPHADPGVACQGPGS